MPVLLKNGGLLPKSRLYVHISSDSKTSVTVGKRHGSPMLYGVKMAKMDINSICEASHG